MSKLYVKIRLLDEMESFPDRKHLLDIGADVFIKENTNFLPHETKALPLGFAVDIPNGYVGFIFSRTSMAKRGIICQLCPIDPGYTGEVFAIVTNLNDDAAVVNKCSAVGQIVVLPAAIPIYTLTMGVARGAKGFGSTDEE